MNIVVTGANGQLGNDIRILATQHSEHHYIFTDLNELDITIPIAIQDFFTENPCDVLINAAAYTAVDKAENDIKAASVLNTDAVRNLALAARSHKFFFIHISTDYVFDGLNHKPYTEEDDTHPISVYGQTKLNGEKEFFNIAPRGVIIRTSWLYSSYGNNFVKTMIRLSQERTKINVVSDQIGTPTYAADLAQAILKIAFENQKIKTNALYHFSNEGVASWYDVATEIMHYFHAKTIIEAIETKDYPTPASRPFYSVLNKQKIKNQFQLHIPYWKDSLYRCLDKISSQQ